MSRVSDDFKYSYPVVGDRVDVYKTKAKVVELEVCSRRFTMEHNWSSDGEDPVLIIELHLTHMWQERGFLAFEKWVTGKE